jgi:hypothetical protein
MFHNFASLLLLASIPFGVALWFQHRMSPQTYATLITIYGLFYIPGTIILIIFHITHHQWIFVPVYILIDVLIIKAIWDAWKRWKDKRKAFAALGNKAKALRDKLVKNMREGMQPSPVRIKG